MDEPDQSYVHGTGLLPLVGLTVGAILDQAAVRWPHREALVVVHQGVRWTWSELQLKARTLAANLIALGLEPGDRVGLLATNRSEWMVVQFATAYAGLILVNINPAFRIPELQYALARVGCRVLITEASFKSSNYIDMIRKIAPEAKVFEKGQLKARALPELRFLICIDKVDAPGFHSFEELAGGTDSNALNKLNDISEKLDFDDPINIQFTSGTTGTPKPAALTHHNIVNNARLSASIMEFTAQDRLCLPVPMYHCFGMVLGSLLCATQGATIVFPSPSFDACEVLHAVEQEKCTALHGVPTMFISELDEPGFADRDLTSLRTGIMAGAPCPIKLMHRVINEMNLSRITIAYGMTETGPLSTQTLPRDPICSRIETVGRVLPHTEIKIVDKNGRIAERDEAGELCTRGYCVMREYWQDPERTSKEIDRAGWIKSGDIATMDAEGYIRIVGRIKDMLIRGGENIFPREIEDFFYGNPKIDQVEVFGVPDQKYGEEVAAWIKLRDGKQASEIELREFCKGKLAHFKIPKYIKFVDTFPMTVTGKVQKYVMREQMAKELGLSQG